MKKSKFKELPTWVHSLNIPREEEVENDVDSQHDEDLL